MVSRADSLSIKGNTVRSTDFNREQLIEIQRGLRQNVDVRLYAKPVYNHFQMREIRLGLLERLKVRFYNNPEFDCLQMYEIRMGLKHNINVKAYARPDISAFRMKHIRERLELENQSLCDGKYRRKDFDSFQWCVLCYGNSLGLDIEAFAKPDLSCGEMVDVMHTIQEGLDNVSQY